MAVMEWRVKSVNMKGIFRTFGTDEERARNFVTIREVEETIKVGKETKKVMVKRYGGSLSSDPGGPYQLQCRLDGTSGNDSTWEDVAV